MKSYDSLACSVLAWTVLRACAFYDAQFAQFFVSIRASIRCRVGARTIDGIKRRTRATMGRCQGGFCTPRLMEILADELGIPQEQVTKFGGESRMVLSRLFPEEK